MMRLWLALAAFMAVASLIHADDDVALSPNYLESYSDWMSVLRDDKLNKPDVSTGVVYDKSAPPKSTRVYDYSAAGTDVRIQIRWYKLEAVSVETGTMTAKVWWRMKWYDKRLAWNASAYGGITRAEYRAHSYDDMEQSEIWLPDVTPYNVHTGLMHALDPATAIVSPDGLVQWSRPGSLTFLCRFSVRARA